MFTENRSAYRSLSVFWICSAVSLLNKWWKNWNLMWKVSERSGTDLTQAKKSLEIVKITNPVGKNRMYATLKTIIFLLAIFTTSDSNFSQMARLFPRCHYSRTFSDKICEFYNNNFHQYLFNPDISIFHSLHSCILYCKIITSWK